MVSRKKGRPRRSAEEVARASRLGKALVQKRTALELSQTEVARRCGWSATRLWKYERGHDVPSLPSLRKLASVLGVELQELIELANGDADDAGVLVSSESGQHPIAAAGSAP